MAGLFDREIYRRDHCRKQEPEEKDGQLERDGDGVSSKLQRAYARRLPPYARELGARLRVPASFKDYVGTSADGRHPTIWLGVGPNAWDWARKNQGLRLLSLLPPGDDPAAYDWRLLAGHNPVFIVSCGDVTDGEVRALVAAIMRDGTQRVIHGGELKVTRYISREVADGTS